MFGFLSTLRAWAIETWHTIYYCHHSRAWNGNRANGAAVQYWVCIIDQHLPHRKFSPVNVDLMRNILAFVKYRSVYITGKERPRYQNRIDDRKSHQLFFNVFEKTNNEEEQADRLMGLCIFYSHPTQIKHVWWTSPQFISGGPGQICSMWFAHVFLTTREPLHSQSATVSCFTLPCHTPSCFV